MEHPSEYQEQPESAQPETSPDSKRRGDNVTHTPIIIGGGGSVKIWFNPHDYPANSTAQNETTHTHPNSAVGAVSIIADMTGQLTICEGVPPNGKCTVTIHCRQPGKFDSNIIVSGDTDLKLTFDHIEFVPSAQASAGSHFNTDRQIIKVEIHDDNPGGQKFPCHLPADRKCTIIISDLDLLQ